VKKHLERQLGVQTVEVSLLDGKVEVTPKDDGQIDPAQLLKATYDSGVTVAQLDVVARGTVVNDPSGGLALRVTPDRSFRIAPTDAARGLEALAASQTFITVRGELYHKPPGKGKGHAPPSLTLSIREVQGRE
jgi:hypothetical protein